MLVIGASEQYSHNPVPIRMVPCRGCLKRYQSISFLISFLRPNKDGRGEGGVRHLEKEAFAILYAVQKLDYYLSGTVFTIKTDHHPLKYPIEAEWTNKKIQQWELKLIGYNYKIEYLAGRDNTCADLLLRIPKQLETGADDKAFQINVINSHRLKWRPTWEDQGVGESKTITGPHWIDIETKSRR